MPDIFKNRHFWLNQDEEPVLIPDVDLTLPEEPAEATAEEDNGEANGEVENDRPPQPAAPDPEEERLEDLKAFYRERLQLTKEELWAHYGPEVENRLQALLQEAYRQALTACKQEILRGLAKIEEGRKEQNQVREAYLAEYTRELKYLAIAIAEKVMQREIAEDNGALDELVAQAAGEIKNAQWMTIEVSDQVKGLADHLREELAKADQGGILTTIAARPIAADACRIVTEDGVVDVSLSVQLEQLRQSFKEAELEEEPVE